MTDFAGLALIEVSSLRIFGILRKFVGYRRLPEEFERSPLPELATRLRPLYSESWEGIFLAYELSVRP